MHQRTRVKSKPENGIERFFRQIRTSRQFSIVFNDHHLFFTPGRLSHSGKPHIHSLTHPLTTFYLGRNLATSKTSHRWEMRTRKYFRSGERKRSIRGKMISWKTNQRKNAIFAILNLRGCKFTDEYFLKFSRGTWKNDIFSGQSNKGSCNCKLCKSKWPEI